MKRALIVKAPYAELIVSGKKIMEMRSQHTKIRERVGIIQQGTGKIIGSVEIIDSVSYAHNTEPLKNEFLQQLHCLKNDDLHLLDKWCVGWHLMNAIKYENPQPYQHPKGAITWVRLTHPLHI